MAVVYGAVTAAAPRVEAIVVQGSEGEGVMMVVASEALRH